MKKTLFRGKRKKNNEWIIGSAIFWESGHISITGKSEWLEETDEKQERKELISVFPETVSESIGLFDKNGNEIFEGDILAYYSDYQNKEIIEGQVKYGNFNCTCCDGVYGWYIENGDIRFLDSGGICGKIEFYVKGNIWDNPELLKKCDIEQQKGKQNE